MTYLPAVPPRAAAALADVDDLLITQSGQPRLTTLAAVKAFLTGGINTGNVVETLTLSTPGAQSAGTAFVLRGTYAGPVPSSLDFTLNGGATWSPATSPTIGGGAFSFSLTVPAANPAQTVQVRDHAAQAVTATSAAFVVSAAAVQVERLWATLKEWRAVATRYEKTANSFMGNLCLAAAIDWIEC